jgi:hypothetical protein
LTGELREPATSLTGGTTTGRAALAGLSRPSASATRAALPHGPALRRSWRLAWRSLVLRHEADTGPQEKTADKRGGGERNGRARS